MLSSNSVVIHDAINHCWFLFSNPLTIISTKQITEVIPILNEVEEQVFNRGRYAAGFMSYEAASAFDSALVTKESDSFPLVWFGIYNQPERFCVQKTIESRRKQSFTWMPSLTRKVYNNAIHKIKKYIETGDTYQVNFTFRLLSSFHGNPWLYFVELVKAQNTIYGAFVNVEEWSICSASPELFFQLDGYELTSRPMKGTAPRGLTLHEDNVQAEWLYHSEKNRAENVMIVDMVRNDMGRIASIGSVRVCGLFTIEKYPTVWQMTSTIKAKTDAGLCEILSALFPPASITGAPKAQTMQIIAELETMPRRIYTGTVGFICPERRAQFNVAIRTVLINKADQKAEYGVGGGIVWDSKDTVEFEECQTKAKILTEKIPDFSLLETILWTPDTEYFLLHYHLARLKDSASYFSFSVDINNVRDRLLSLIPSFTETAYKIRVLVAKDGQITCQAKLFQHFSTTLLQHVCFAKSPVNSSNPFLYHKTTNRSVYDKALASCPDYNDVILWNEKGEITESCIANIVVELDRELYTPPVRCGLLPGTYRAFMLENGNVKEKVIRKKDILANTHVFLINSVRKQQEIVINI